MNPKADSVCAAPGWHGKLPSLGDFASRRLEPAFIEPWDGWLAAGLLALREAQPQGWLEAYLASPSWRFLLMPGVLPGEAGASAWAGVLMPSVDKVGRYFPLTLVQPLGAGLHDTQQMTALWHWLGRLDELARDALFDDWTADRLEDELARMARPAITPPASAAEPAGALATGFCSIAFEDAAPDAAVHIAMQAQQRWATAARGQAWWYARPDDTPAQLLLSHGLPPAASLARLFGAAATI